MALVSPVTALMLFSMSFFMALISFYIFSWSTLTALFCPLCCSCGTDVIFELLLAGSHCTYVSFRPFMSAFSSLKCLIINCSVSSSIMNPSSDTKILSPLVPAKASSLVLLEFVSKLNLSS
jgi:hypothetical protein